MINNSKTSQAILVDNLKKSFSNYEELTLPQYTPEQIQAEIEKGEKAFFTQASLVEMKEALLKGEIQEEGAQEILEQIKALQKVAIVKSDDEVSFGYFLDKPIEEEIEG